MTMRSLLHLRTSQHDLTSPAERAIVHERYLSLRRQIPIIYLLGGINLAGLELATGGSLKFGLNVPSAIFVCGLFRVGQWFGMRGEISDSVMLRRMRQTSLFAGLICLMVCIRCLQLLDRGDAATHMAVLLFGGLTAIGVAYGLTAMPIAGLIPLVLIAVPLAIKSLFSNDRQFVSASLSLVVVAVLTLRLLLAHNRHFVDVVRSRSRIAREQELAEHAHQEAIVAATTDFLTGLPNRRAFIAALEQVIEKNAQSESFAVAILDLDRFKSINDTFGHGMGDLLLQEVAARLVRATSNRALVARLGGDEFGILFEGIEKQSDAQTAGSEILRLLNGPATLDGRRIEVSACCGFGISRKGEGRSPSRVLADADLALYQAKEKGAGLSVFEKRMEASRSRRARIERALHAASLEQHIALVYQPIFDLSTGQVIAYEALARWNDPELGEISPAEFIPIAERLNVIGGITAQLMAKAFAVAAAWPTPTRLSFNLSAIQLCTPGSAKLVLKALKHAGLPTDRLQVEVTETALLADFTRAKRNLAELRSAGATIVLDDFGAGFASIGYLRELRFDQIKLDGGLVTAAQNSSDGERLLRAVIALCDILGVASVAEHVESEELAKLLIRLGCTAGQGFWLHPPVTSDQLAVSCGATEALSAARKQVPFIAA